MKIRVLFCSCKCDIMQMLCYLHACDRHVCWDDDIMCTLLHSKIHMFISYALYTWYHKYKPQLYSYLSCTLMLIYSVVNYLLKFKRKCYDRECQLWMIICTRDITLMLLHACDRQICVDDDIMCTSQMTSCVQVRATGNSNLDCSVLKFKRKHYDRDCQL